MAQKPAHNPPPPTITGTGRCGTRFTALVLRELGIKAGHESYFNPKDQRKPGLDVEVSWLAAGYDEDFPMVTQLRNPINVINSFLGLRFFLKTSGYAKFAFRNCPNLDRSASEVVNALRWVVFWNQKCIERSSMVYRLEDIGLELPQALNLLGFSVDSSKVGEAVKSIPSSTNSRPKKSLTFSQLPDDGGTKELLRELMVAYDYPVTDRGATIR